MLRRDLQRVNIAWVKFIEMNATMCEGKSTLDGIHGRLDMAEEKIKELKIARETIHKETHREKKIEQSITDLWENSKWPNISGTGDSENKKGGG